jgi:alcohol dehydrogenase/propanol-preferring alcohol dehydrogenase
MGGADVILATAPNSKAISQLVGGLSSRGNLVIVAAAADNMEVVPFALLSGKKISGWPSGHAKESEETLEFSAMSDIRPKIETFPLEKVNEAYDKMITNKVRFRAVLRMD